MIRSYFWCLVALLLSLPMLLPAQSKWSFGFSMGGGLSSRDQVIENNSPGTTSSFYYTESFHNNLALGGGMWVSYQLTPWLGLQTGLRYRNVGNEYSYQSQTYTEATDQMLTNYYSGTEIRVHQLQVPLLAEAAMQLGHVRPFFRVGGNFQKDIGFQLHEESYDPRSGKILASHNSVVGFEGNHGIQIEAALGLYLNERMALSLHRTWSGSQTVMWSPYLETVNSFGGNVMICGDFSHRTTKSYHRQQLFLTFEYTL